jgi:predicted metal-dependent peptidase
MLSIQEEVEQIVLSLDNYHSIFAAFWQYTSVVETEKIPTAAVAFDKENFSPQLLINPKFWNSLEDYDKVFILCHECLHVIYNHGLRAKKVEKAIGGIQKNKSNIAMDIVVNHGLVDNIGFNRNAISIQGSLVWLDTTFDENELKTIEPNREYEYYYQRVHDDDEQESIDSHDFLESFEDYDGEAFIENVMDGLSQEEKQEISIGDMPGDQKKKIQDQKLTNKRKWEDVVEAWTAKGVVVNDNWTRYNRRLGSINTNFILPGKADNEEIGGKAKIWFFQDTSGSCTSYTDFFFNASKTFPKDRFDITKFCFDTKTYKMENDELQGFGGTNFRCINDVVNQAKVHPDAIFVFTDGYGTHINPKMPERWYFFLFGSSTRDYIPRQSKIFSLQEFVK